MKCASCGFAASTPTVSRCPFCQGALMGTTAVASLAAPQPAPASAIASAQEKYGLSAAEAYQRQQQVGILMVLCAYACDLLAFFLLGFLPKPYAHDFWVGFIVISLPLHFRGFAHCAQAKGYSRLTGWLLALLSGIGAVILCLMSDKTKIQA